MQADLSVYTRPSLTRSQHYESQLNCHTQIYFLHSLTSSNGLFRKQPVFLVLAVDQSIHSVHAAFQSGSICHKINLRGIFMVKANHLPRCVKGNLRNTKNVVGNFVTCTGGRYGGLFLDLYRTTWNRGSNIKWRVNTINYNKFPQKYQKSLIYVCLIHIHRLKY